MELHEFPRPPQDNGRGVHWSLSVYEWGKRGWNFWRDQLLAMQIKWVKIMDDGGGSGLRLARQLIDMEIMPVVRLYRPQQNPGTIGQRGRETVAKYVDNGIFYFEFNNEPDLDLEWREGKKPSNWLELVVDDFIRDADIILEEGGYPAFPAFGVGAQLNPFWLVAQKGHADLFDNGVWVAVHNYCLGRPLEYPNDLVNTQGIELTQQEWEAAGGTWAWEMSVDDVNRARRENVNPNASIVTDSTCFRAFEQVNSLVVDMFDHSVPVMMTEGGYNVGQRAGTTFGDDARYAKPTPQTASQMSLEMFRYMQGNCTILGAYVPDYFFAAMPWLIAAYRIGVWAAPAENQGPWFTDKYNDEFGLHGELPLVQMLKDMPTKVRQDGPKPTQWSKPLWEEELGAKWDNRLKYLGVTKESVACDGLYWKLIEAKWYDEDEVTVSPDYVGAGYIYVRVLDKVGMPIEGAFFVVQRSNKDDIVTTKGLPDGYWGNYAMYGDLGTYIVKVLESRYPSEAVVGLGLGLDTDKDLWAHVSFRLVFQLTDTNMPDKTMPDAQKILSSINSVGSSVDDTVKLLQEARCELSS